MGSMFWPTSVDQRIKAAENRVAMIETLLLEAMDRITAMEGQGTGRRRSHFSVETPNEQMADKSEAKP